MRPGELTARERFLIALHTDDGRCLFGAGCQRPCCGGRVVSTAPEGWERPEGMATYRTGGGQAAAGG